MAKAETNINIALEEELWGFRFYEGAAIVILLEFLFSACRGGLNVSAKSPKGRIETSAITAPSHLALRSLVFNNPMLETASDWDDWESAYRNKVTEKLSLLENWSADYLKRRFSSFEDFRKAIRLVQASAVRLSEKDRKWTNKFLFPWDQEQIFPDVKIDKDNGENKAKLTAARNHFGHSGEMACLILTLADDRKALQQRIDQRFKRAGHVMSRLCAVLEGDWAENPKVHMSEGSSYLPQDADADVVLKKRADMLCRDLMAILDLNLTTEDVVDPMARIIGIHLACCQLERAMRFAEAPRFRGNGRPYFLCESIQKQTSAMRRNSRACFSLNGQLCQQVILEVFGRRFSEVEAAAPGEGRINMLREKLALKNYPVSEEDWDMIAKNQELPELREMLRDRIIKKFSKHSGNFHSEMARAVGLATKVYTTSYRYAPSDELMLALALATVQNGHMSFREFLDHLYEKYGLVFDEECWRKAMQSRSADARSVDRPETKDLADNAGRLLDQMMSLGLLKHLSDGCDYVTNPYYRSAEHA